MNGITHAETLARAAGWASLGLTVVSVLAPGVLGRAFGLGERRALVRALGARDLVVGAGLVFANDPRPWMRARLASELFDAVLHGAGGLTGHFDRRRALAVATAAVLIGGVDYVLLHALRRH